MNKKLIYGIGAVVLVFTLFVGLRLAQGPKAPTLLDSAQFPIMDIENKSAQFIKETRKIDGVYEVSVDKEWGYLNVKFDPKAQTEEQIFKILKEKDLPITEPDSESGLKIIDYKIQYN